MRKLLLISLVVSLIFLAQPVYAESSFGNNSTISSGGSNISGTNFFTDLIIFPLLGNVSGLLKEAQFGFFYAIMNNPPECSTIPDQTWNQDLPKTINLMAYVSDIDNDTLTFSNFTPVSDITTSYNQDAGVVTLTPAAGFSGTRNIIFVAGDYADTTECNSVKLTISSTAVPPTTTTSPPGQSRGDSFPSESVSTGFNLDKSLFHVKLIQGETKRETLRVNNVGDERLEFIVDIGDLKKFVIADEYAFEIEPGKAKVLNFDFFAAENEIEDVHTGKISIKTDGKSQSINTIVEIISKKALFDILLSVFPESRELERGEPLRANITLINLGNLKGVDVEVDYIIKNMDGKAETSQHETRGVLGEQLSYTKEFDTGSLKKGDYVIYTKITYQGAIASSSELFTMISGKSALSIILPYIAGAVAMIFILIIIIAIIAVKNGERIDERLLIYINSIKDNFKNAGFKEAAEEKLVSVGWKKRTLKKAFKKAGIEDKND